MDLRSRARLIAGRFRRAWSRHYSSADEAENPASELLEARTAAEVRARELLLRMLSPAQREDFRRKGYFAVQVAGLGRFWILPSTFFNVLHAETGDCYCAAPRAEVPLSDLMLAQKLLLESDPQAFFTIANRRPELIPGLVEERLFPDRVLQARRSAPRPLVRWLDVSMIPHQSQLP